MKYIKYNNEELSKLSLGTVQFGLDYGIANKNGKPTINEVKSIIDYIIDYGINCFDTAVGYGDSERILGKILPSSSDLKIISKIGSSDFFSIHKIIEKSLNNLRVNELYGLLLHDARLLPTWDAKYENIVKELKKDKIKYFGVSIYTNEEFNLALDNNNIDIIQIPFNLFDQRAIQYNWFKKAKDKNKLLFVRSIFLQGLLLMDISSVPKKLEKARKYIKILDNICQTHNCTKEYLALSFVNTLAKESIILFGCETKEQAMQNITSFKKIKELDDIMIKILNDSFSHIDQEIYDPTRW